MKFLILLSLFLLIGCGKSKFIAQGTCEVQDTSTGAIIKCDGQDPIYINDGVDGIDGDDYNIFIVDPCGNTPNKVDEVILILPNGVVLGWHRNIGLAVLTTGVIYRTTDHQKCDFIILDGGVVQEL